MRLSLSLSLSLLGLACVRVGDGTDETIADASESMSSESTGATTMASSETSTSEAGSTTETSSSSTETSTEASSTETSTETSSTETSTETGVDGVTVDLGVLALVDVNPNSASANQKLHPLDYEGRLSAWYFAHAT